MEENKVSLRESHHKDEEDRSKPDNVLSQHPVHHDHHGSNQLESATEEQKIWSSKCHNDNC